MSSIATPPTPAPDAPSNRRGRLIVAWVLSVGLAFLLGMQVRPLTQPAAPAQTATASADAAQATPEPAASTPPQPNPELERFLLDLPRRDPNDPLAMGKVDAKVVMTNWSDYRCPFCAV